VESSKPDGLDQLVVDAEHNRVVATFNRGLYPLDAIYGASYIFIDRCYVLLDLPDAEHVSATLTGREAMDAEGLGELGGEFANELLAQAWRREITEYNKPLIEAVAAQALAGATGGPGLDGLDELSGEMDFSEETFEDPLGIAMSWEEKYGKKTTPPVAAEPPHPPKPAEAKDAVKGDADDDDKAGGGTPGAGAAGA